MTYLHKQLVKAARASEVRVGESIEVEVDLALAHDGTCPKLLKTWNPEERFFDGRKVVITVDHAFPAPTPEDRAFQKELKSFCQDQGCVLYSQGEGVLHQVVAERVSLWPGMIIAGADGHVATSGAFGAIAFSLSPEGLAPVLKTGKLTIKVPEQVTVEVKGELKEGVLARDAAFYLFEKIGYGLKGKAIGFAGSFFEGLSDAGRMTICNLMPEGGAVTAFVIPIGEGIGEINVSLDAGEVEPMVAVPPEPTAVKKVQEVAGTKINVAIAGGCSAGRLEDMEVIAEVLANETIHPDVTFIITPASQKVAREMEEKGISLLLRDKGAIIMPPGCGPCPGKHFGVLAPGDVAITTTIRNNPGRIGSNDASIYLASPLTVAKAAVKGYI
ncbi:MAG: aconitase family protein [Desulfitobacterium hafniense]|nr:aconitase family protein [Desulfitobacterium hafniense]